MVCDNCGSGDPVIHLTQIVDNEMRTLHLCEECAAEKGVEGSAVPENFPLSDFLAQMGTESGLGGEGGEHAQEPAPDPSHRSGGSDVRSCPFCQLTLKEFRDSGRMGCPECWSSFEGHLRGLLRRIHGSHQHLGKVYLSPDPSSSELKRRLSALRRKLQRAVELEDFERAAELRDEIHAMEPSSSEGGS